MLVGGVTLVVTTRGAMPRPRLTRRPSSALTTLAPRATVAASSPTAVAPRPPARYIPVPTMMQMVAATWSVVGASPSDTLATSATSSGEKDSRRLVVAAGCDAMATTCAPWVRA